METQELLYIILGSIGGGSIMLFIPFFCLYKGVKQVFGCEMCNYCTHTHHIWDCKHTFRKYTEAETKEIKIPKKIRTGRFEKVNKTIEKKVPDGTESVAVTKYKTEYYTELVTKYRSETRQSQVSRTRCVPATKQVSKYNGSSWQTDYIATTVNETYYPTETVQIPYQENVTKTRSVPYTDYETRPKCKTEYETVTVDEEIIDTIYENKTVHTPESYEDVGCICTHCMCDLCTTSGCWLLFYFTFMVWIPTIVCETTATMIVFYTQYWYYFAAGLGGFMIIWIIMNKLVCTPCAKLDCFK